jgi:hypothetical protein
MIVSTVSEQEVAERASQRQQQQEHIAGGDIQ